MLIFALAGILVVLAVRTILLAQLDERTDSSLTQERNEFARFLNNGVDPRTGGPVEASALGRAGILYIGRTVLDQGEALLVVREGRPPVRSQGAPYDLARDAALVAEWQALREPQLRTIETPAGEARVLAVPTFRGQGADRELRGTFVVASFTAAEREEVTDALLVVAEVSGGAVLLVGLLAWSIAGRVLRPLSDMTATARRITQENLGGRLEERPGEDELAVLVRTFNGMLDRLERVIGTQRAFLADAGHDLRTPLTIVRGNLDQLRAGLVPEDEREETLEMMGDEVGRMSRLVEDLMLLARSQQPDFLHVGPVDLGDLATALGRRAETLEGPAWRVVAGVGVIEADAERLTQAALNLITNAVRYSPAGLPVTIGTRLLGGTAEVWVADSGPGVPAEGRTQIFDRFVRGPERRRSGTGLGLAIARAIAEAHGGDLTVSRAQEGGARFVLRFPATGVPLELSYPPREPVPTS